MIEFLDTLTLFWLKYIMFPSFLLGIIGFFFFMYSVSNEKKQRKTTKVIGVTFLGLLVFSSLVSIALTLSLQALIKKEIQTLLNEPELTIEINQEKLAPEYANRVITELKNIGNATPDHSHPEKEIRIKLISKNNSLMLRLARDSRRRFEFWIFSDTYEYTKNNSIGNLSTMVFLRYKNTR